jgi:hypothetical protein
VSPDRLAPALPASKTATHQPLAAASPKEAVRLSNRTLAAARRTCCRAPYTAFAFEPVVPAWEIARVVPVLTLPALAATRRR